MTRRIRRELKTVRVMIGLACRRWHGGRGGLCVNCALVWDYTRQRIEGCQFCADKPTCVNCTVHCFKPAMRERIRQVMRFAGPRMIWRHPLLTLFHVLDGRRPAPERTSVIQPQD